MNDLQIWTFAGMQRKFGPVNRIALVGNGTVEPESTPCIERANVVVRFNNWATRPECKEHTLPHSTLRCDLLVTHFDLHSGNMGREGVGRPKMVVIGIPAPFQIDTIPEKAARWHPDAALAMVHPYWNRELCKALALDSPGDRHPLPTLGMTALYHLARMKLPCTFYVCGFDWHFDLQRDTIQGHAIDTDRLPANFNHWYIKEAVWVARNLYGTPAWEFSGRAARTLERLRDRTFAWETQHTIENRNLSDSAPGRPGKTMQSEIPKIAHFIWLGETLPPWASDNIERFARLHPGWEIRLCRDVPPEMPADLRQRVAGSRLACMQADLIRYWLVYESGGVYLDADTYAWRNMGPLLGSRTLLGHMLDGRITNSVIASPPRSAGMEAILSAVRSLTHDAGKRTLYGPGMLGGVIESAPERFQVCPAHYFNCIGTQQTAHRFWNATHAEQTKMLSHWKGRMVDGVEPYSFHLWGVDGSSYAKTSVTHNCCGSESGAGDSRSRFAAEYRGGFRSGLPETACGQGSTLRSTEHVRRLLPELLRRHGIRVVNDAGCGDFHWMREVVLDGIDYCGYDVVAWPEWEVAKSPSIRFEVRDITSEPLRACDLALCRDTLFHLSNEMVMRALTRFRESSTWLLATTHDIETNGNRHGRLRGFSPLNLRIEPFCLGEPVDSIDEPLLKRRLGLWRLGVRLVRSA